MEDWKLQPAHDLGLPLRQRLRSLRRESGLIETGAHMVWWSLVHGYLLLCHRLRVLGGEHIPRDPPFILIGNHASHLDALVLASPLPLRLRDRIFPVAAGDVFFETPILTAFAVGVLNALPIWRRKCGPHAMQEFRKRLLEEPCSYILFPEGGRSRDGAMKPFKAGLGMLVAGTSVPVVPCYLEGTFEALPPNARLPRFRPITLRIGTPLVFASVTNDMAGWKEIARTTEEAVRGLRPAEGSMTNPIQI